MRFLFLFLFSRLLAQPIPIINAIDAFALPQTFRKTDLNASASGQFSEQGLKAILRELDLERNIFMIDLREESHCFVQGHAISWYVHQNRANRGKTLAEILEDEERHLQSLRDQSEISVYKLIKLEGDRPLHPTVKIPLAPSRCQLEKTLCETNGVRYFRLPIQDHMTPSNQQVDRFLKFIHELPPKAWLHFHCSAGMGRSTTLLVLLDIFHNAKKISLDEIIKRQHLLGGSDLSNRACISERKLSYHAARFAFIQRFYAYCKESGSHKKTWSEWLRGEDEADLFNQAR